MTNIFFEKELVKTLLLYHPELAPRQSSPDKPILSGHIRKAILSSQLTSLFESDPKLGVCDPTLELKRFGKCTLNNRRVLSSMLSEAMGNTSRADQWSRCYFEFKLNGSKQPLSIGFFEISLGETKQHIVAYNPLINIFRFICPCRSHPPPVTKGSVSICKVFLWTSGHRLFILAYMIAPKMICDDTYSNNSWTIVQDKAYSC
jgi:hypothetical protein